MARKKIREIVIAVFVLLITTTDSAWALQSHGAPEGVYVHQIAHLLFAGALIYLYWHTRRTPTLAGRGWKYLQTFCIIFACWNIIALAGHEAFSFLSAEDFIDKNSWNERIAGPLNFTKVLYFITKMDHLLFVPAMLALVISLRTLYADAAREEQK
ncbi:MAG TPA: hypothetical protein VJ969_07125 [Desulfopila sp.]|nr:hypothetical protein [Desulfopila sp.]